MNIHEFQAKQLFDQFGVATPDGRAASTPEEAFEAAQALGDGDLVVKAQVHAGGRGKGTFKNGFQGGVHLCGTAAEAKELASKMLGETLVTHQTGEEGKLVRQVLIAKSVDIAKVTTSPSSWTATASVRRSLLVLKGVWILRTWQKTILKRSLKRRSIRRWGCNLTRHARLQAS